MTQVLVTGANGFVGAAVAARLAADGHRVRGAVRSAAAVLPAGVAAAPGHPLAAGTDWRGALAGTEVVVHCAARVHVLRETAADPLAAFRAVNVEGTLTLARQAATTGVRRFVFVSSIGVHGGQTFDRPYRADDEPAPHTPYAQSKLEAETALRALADDAPMELVVVRPPLVFGPGAPGNFERLMRALQRGLPLPFGAVDNRRSFVALGNLVDLLAVLVEHPRAAGGTFLVSDGEDLSTTELLRRTARALGRPARLLPVPAALLQAAAGLLGRRDFAQRLLGSLQVDPSATRERLGWEPPLRFDDVLRDTAAHFLAEGRAR